MSPVEPPRPRPSARVRQWTAAVLVLIGAALAAFKIVEDSEPGALPLALILFGAALFVVARLRRSAQDQ